ncbi:MAG: type 1 glutamine amidotransferase domain-containing protein, partial [Geminicoccaceae bacterium]|nr:type 1 glutamine amidotransferase domain-containing protein [Geminicoccaceae bacterium]
MNPQFRIAIVATSAERMGEGGKPTGVWLEELTSPYYALVDAGFLVDVYSMAGGTIPVDPNSMNEKGKNDASVERYLDDPDARERFAATLSAASIELANYDAVFLPGGHGTMWDFPSSATLASIVAGMLAAGRPVGAVCHGPAGLVSAQFADGTPVVAGKTVAGFSNSEEASAGLTETVPFLLEDRLRSLGANYRSGPDFEPFAVRDGLLVTGQNPASAGLTVNHLIEAL